MKEAFSFAYTIPTYDWFERVQVEIKPDEYEAFGLERRFGPSWWIIGKKILKPTYHWEEKSLGEINNYDLKRFVEWAKNDVGGSDIVEIKMICSSFDVFKEVLNIGG